MIGQSFSFDGTNFAQYGIMVIKGPTTGMAEPRLDFQDYSARDGGVAEAITLKPIYVSRTVDLYGDDKTDVWEKFDTVQKLLDPREGNKELIFDEMTNIDTARNRGYLARLNEPISKVHWKAPLVVRFNLSWIVPSGCARALADTSETPTIDASPKTFYVPDSAAEVVGGNRVLRPVWRFRNTTSGNVTAVTLTNTTRTETCRWTGILIDDDYIKFDSNREHIESSADLVTWVSRISGITAGDPFPLLTNGVRNECVITGMTTADASIVFRGEFF